MQFEDPMIMALALLAVPLVILLNRFQHKGGLSFSDLSFFPKARPSLKLLASKYIYLLRVAALVLGVIALGRPQSPLEETRIQTEGLDIVLAVDVSSSMLAEDFTVKGKRANRLAAVKEVVNDFVKHRQNDRIGLVAFAARAYTVCPLTLDYGWFLENMERLEIGLIEDGTAVGAGLSSSLNRIKDTESKEKVVILLTDGRNNAGDISPFTAAEASSSLGVKVYTIGAGTKGHAPYPMKDFLGNTVYQPVQIDIDENTLRKIAEETGGEYFRATDTASLQEIYERINELEKTKMEEQGYMEYKELFPYFLLPALLLLLLEVILRNTLLRRIP